MSTVVTDQGLQAIRNADAGGFLVSLTKFKLSSEVSFIPLITDTGMIGEVFYEGDISLVEALGTNSVKLTLSLPSNFPAEGAVYISEVGVYLHTGELFAHAKLDTAVEKTAEFDFEMYLVVSSARLGDLINITNTNQCSIASTPHVHTLMQPTISTKNVVAVLDGLLDNSNLPTGTLAIKFGSGGVHWAFVGYTRQYTGFVEKVSNTSSFTLTPETNAGFWLSEGEEVIVQIISGDGAGQSRKAIYNKPGLFTVQSKPFTAFSLTSNVSIWRRDSNVIPARDISIPDHYVLRIGQHDWKRVTTSSTQRQLIPAWFTLLGVNAQSDTISIPADIRSLLNFDIVEDNFLIHRNQEVVPHSSYTLLYDNSGIPISIQFLDSIVQTDVFEILLFAYKNESPGSYVFTSESSYDAVSLTTSSLPFIPSSEKNVLCYLDGKLYTLFTLDGSTVVFDPPVTGRLNVIPYVMYEDEGTKGDVHHITVLGTAGQTVINTTFTLVNKTDTLIYIGGLYLGRDSYTIINNSSIELATPLVENTKIEIVVLASEYAQGATSSVTGVNTGPVWSDPAGSIAPPNSWLVSIQNEITTGKLQSFNLPVLKSQAHALMFINGQFQHPESVDRFEFETKTVLRLKTEVQADLEVEFIIFTEFQSPGSLISGNTINFTTTNSKTYDISLPGTLLANSVMMFMGGVYQHRSSYSYTNSSITLNDVPPSNVPVEIYYFTQVEQLGYRTDISLVSSYTDILTKHSRVQDLVSRVEDSLVFLGTVYQKKSEYSILQESLGMYYASWNDLDVSGVRTAAFTLRSSFPVTRLVPRPEFQTLSDWVHDVLDGGIKWTALSPSLRRMLACPISKLLDIVTGKQVTANTGDNNADMLIEAFGLQPKTFTVELDVLQTADYTTLGGGAMLNYNQTFNVFRYLETYIEQQLGTTSFAIKDYERNVKYVINNIKVGALNYEAIAREEIPNVTWNTGVYVQYPAAGSSSTYAGMPMLATYFDLKWFSENVGYGIDENKPEGWYSTNTDFKTVSVSTLSDDVAQTHTYTHTIRDPYGAVATNYTVKWRRPFTVPDPNIEYLELVDAGGAPPRVVFFARMYASYQYNDIDIRSVMDSCWNPGGVNSSINTASAWTAWLVSVRSSTEGNYPARAGYTAGIAFSASLSDINMETGDAKIKIELTSGTIGYTWFPAQMFIKTMTLPVTYTVYPAIVVQPDGTTSPAINVDSVFTDCCWSGVTQETTLDCASL